MFSPEAREIIKRVGKGCFWWDVYTACCPVNTSNWGVASASRSLFQHHMFVVPTLGSDSGNHQVVLKRGFGFLFGVTEEPFLAPPKSPKPPKMPIWFGFVFCSCERHKCVKLMAWCETVQNTNMQTQFGLYTASNCENPGTRKSLDPEKAWTQ